MPYYTRTMLKASLNARLHGKIGRLVDANETINRGVKEAFSETDFRSSKRVSSSPPNLFDEVYDYSAPVDLKGQKIIDIDPQVERGDDEWHLVTPEEFARRKTIEDFLVAVRDADGLVRLKISRHVDDTTLIVATLDALSYNGANWALFGDGTNLRTDADNYVKGNGAVRWDISAAAGTTAGIQHTSLPTFDLTDYLSAGSVFVWAWITSTTGLTNYKIRLGSDGSNYYEMTATTTNEATAFRVGWNLIRFDFSAKTTTGSPVAASCDFAAVFMTKTTGKVSELDYRFDHIMVKRGKLHDTHYYSAFPWQNSSGTYLEESTSDNDYLNVRADEYNIILEKCVEAAGNDAREYDDAAMAAKKYSEKRTMYLMDNPSEALLLTSTYHDIQSITG